MPNPPLQTASPLHHTGLASLPIVCQQRPEDGTKGAIGGAVLGGLLGGPFGALFGAQIGGAFGANAGARNRRGWLPLHHSAAKGHADVTVVLLGGAADAKLVNELDQKGRAPLYLAALKGSAPTVRALLAAGADRALQDKETAEIALHGAAKMGDVECVRSLLDDEHGLLVRDKSSWLAVHHAAAAGHAGALEVLLAHEPKLLELTTGEGLDTLLHLACARDQLECVAVLFREMKQRDLLAASADKRNSGGRTPLFAAADGNDGRGDGGAQRSREGERCTRITRGLLRAGARGLDERAAPDLERRTSVERCMSVASTVCMAPIAKNVGFPKVLGPL